MRSSRVARLVTTAVVLILATPIPAVAGDDRFNLESPDAAPNGRPFTPVAQDPALPDATGRILVAFKPGQSPAARAQALEQAGAALDPTAPRLNSMVVVQPSSRSPEATLSALQHSPAVETAELEYRYFPSVEPLAFTCPSCAEPLFVDQWSLNNTGQVVGGYAGAPNVDMNLPEAWPLAGGGVTAGTGVVVAVIDSGIDFSHPDLVGTAWINPGESGGGKETDGLDNDSNGYVDDVNGWDFCHDDNTVFEVADGTDASHGTAMASIIAANVDGSGMAGIAPGVSLMALKFLGAGCGTAAQAIAAIEYAADRGVRVANASWGGSGFSASLKSAIETSGMLFVAAAGNDGVDTDLTPRYPSSYDSPNILSVASTHNEGFLSEFSNFGRESVDFAAPGEDVWMAYTTSDPDPHTWILDNGTSPAAAMTSGVAALVGSIRADLLADPISLRAHLVATGKPLHRTLGATASGRMPDARAALVAVPDIVRLSGADRYATAAAISQSTFFRYPDVAFVATGANFPDALSGGAVGAQFNWPVLLVSKDAIPAASATELSRLQPLNIFVLGGTGVISSQVESQLGAYIAGDGDVIRLAGPDRFSTSVAVSQGFDPGVETAYIATGLNFPDALSAAPPAALSGGPLLLVTQNAIPAVIATELSRLDPGRIVILGGTGVVSTSVESQLNSYTAGSVVRIAGANRYATAAATSSYFFSASETAFIATGLNFPDALAGGPAGGTYQGPVLLVPGTTVPQVVKDELLRLQPARIFILGGTGVVSNTVVSEISGLFP